MRKFTMCLWFNDRAEEAAKFYVSVFKRSKITGIAHYGEAAAKASGRPKGSVMTVSFRLEGQEFLALNGGPEFTFTPAVSIMVNCRNQGEIDALWEKLSAGGEKGQCGWLKDKFGVSWQITPALLGRRMLDKDVRKREKTMEALMTMTKIDIRALKRAA